jgi:hypothetical protein
MSVATAPDSKSPTLYVIPGGRGRAAVIDRARSVPNGTDPITELASADFNGDGRADVAIGRVLRVAPWESAERLYEEAGGVSFP